MTHSRHSKHTRHDTFKCVPPEPRSVREYVRTYVGEQVARARQALKSYGEAYTCAMLQALQATRRGAFLIARGVG